jgi:hypothetical protein
MITVDDYTFAESQVDDHWAVRLLTEYPGVTYMYGKVQVKEHPDGTASIDFKYKILDSADFDADELEQSDDFRNRIGNVMQHIIEDAADNGKMKLNDRSKSTTNNNTESPLQ